MAEIGARALFLSGVLPLYREFSKRDESFISAWRLTRNRADPDKLSPYVCYDAELGWKNIPNLSQTIADGNPPVTTNGAGIRSNAEIPREKSSAETRRLLVIGGDYAFGLGVADGEHWTALLQAEMKDSEVINLGVPEYGLDQALLLFMRDADLYSADVLIVPITLEDCRRAGGRFRFYAKPRYLFENGTLRLKGVPVPSPRDILRQYESDMPMSYALHFAAQWRGVSEAAQEEDENGLMDLTRALVEQICASAKQRGTKVLFMYIPPLEHYQMEENPLGGALAVWSRTMEFELLDLTPIFLKLSVASSPPICGTTFTPFGNLVVAMEIRNKLAALQWGQSAREIGKVTDESIEGRITGFADLQSVLKGDPVREAEALRQEGKTAEAEKLLQESVARGAEAPEVYFNLGVMLARDGKTTEAMENFQKALDRRSGYVEARFNLGQMFAARGQLVEAAAQFEETVRLKPGYAEAHQFLGAILDQQGKTEQGVAHLREAIRLKPDYAEAHLNLGVALGGIGKLEESETEFREALRLKPDDAEAHNSLGVVQQERGQLENALACYRNALRVAPDFV
ncbi:tetratricopeptide repeat protein, partial [Candidatus Sumerlaeota bacterium]|nr:tetratricopeptide repeat protein [Candidatus Sumerlaeota bacterium]